MTSELADRVEAATQWRAVPGWPYEASDAGDLRSSITGRPLRPTVNQRGYAQTTFQHNLVRRTVRVHRAVYEAWHGPLPPGLTINHLNGIKLDNRPCNLEACTSAENTRHAAAMGLMPSGRRNGTWTRPETRRPGSKQANAKLTETDIPRIRELVAAGKRQTDIARELGVSRSAINMVIKGRSWAHV